jgi:hypothetical protein
VCVVFVVVIVVVVVVVSDNRFFAIEGNKYVSISSLHLYYIYIKSTRDFAHTHKTYLDPTRFPIENVP